MNTAPASTVPFSEEAVRQMTAAFGESPAAADLRREAWNAYVHFPVPSREDEAWRRTDISRLDLDRFALSVATAAPGTHLPADFAQLAGGGEALLLHDDAGFHRRLPAEWKDQGVIFTDLATAMTEHRALVEKHLLQAVSPRRGKFEALNGALWNRGVFLYVPKGADVAVPLRGGYSFRPADGAACLPRTVVVVEEGARVTYFDEYASSDPADPADQSLACAAVELFVGPGAELRYVNIQRWGAGVWHFLTQNARLERDAKLTTLVVALGGRLSKANLGSELLGPGATSLLYGLVFGDRSQQFTHQTSQDHQVPNTSSDLLFKAALKDRSRSIYTGLVRIAKEAQKSNAFQTSRNLLLSPEARANTIPTLEILADDVKCGHGATVGSLDDDQRFYLMSRGLDRREAEHTIVEGFFEDVLQRVPDEPTREKLRAAIDVKLG
jgi:Fe-S cluster assembly protein SufD